MVGDVDDEVTGQGRGPHGGFIDGLVDRGRPFEHLGSVADCGDRTRGASARHRGFAVWEFTEERLYLPGLQPWEARWVLFDPGRQRGIADPLPSGLVDEAGQARYGSSVQDLPGGVANTVLVCHYQERAACCALLYGLLGDVEQTTEASPRDAPTGIDLGSKGARHRLCDALGVFDCNVVVDDSPDQLQQFIYSHGPEAT